MQQPVSLYDQAVKNFLKKHSHNIIDSNLTISLVSNNEELERRRRELVEKISQLEKELEIVDAEICENEKGKVLVNV